MYTPFNACQPHHTAAGMQVKRINCCLAVDLEKRPRAAPHPMLPIARNFLPKILQAITGRFSHPIHRMVISSEIR